jgi:hypothetical protein
MPGVLAISPAPERSFGYRMNCALKSNLRCEPAWEAVALGSNPSALQMALNAVKQNRRR